MWPILIDMFRPEGIKISEYDYNLPEERIAKYPLPVRDDSLLLHYNRERIEHLKFSGLTGILKSNDMLVFNDTRVIQARLEFKKHSGARIELFLLEPVQPTDYQAAFQQTRSCRWRCMVGNAKKWKEGELFEQVDTGSDTLTLGARNIKKEENTSIIEFFWRNDTLSFAEIVEIAGHTPIPPYLNRSDEPDDKIRYQTIYSLYNGSVAAPTAGLHFTDSVLKNMKRKGIDMNYLTLHVGAGTFTPVKEEDATLHAMHAETVSVNKSIVEAICNHDGRIIAVGTTSTRSLESLYWLGYRAQLTGLDPESIELSQWEVYGYNHHLSRRQCLEGLISFMEEHQMDEIKFQTRIMIVPGYEFRMADGLITNFHLPRSTLLLLIAAFIGDNWKAVYDYALKNNFRFLSYGDSSILFP